MNYENQPRPNRREAQPVFGRELEDAIQNINQGIIITGPSGSGKTILGTAVTTLGLAAVNVELPPQENVLADFAVAGYPLDRNRFFQDVQDDMDFTLEHYIDRYSKLPPVLMVDEILPEYAGFMAEFRERAGRMYQAYHMSEPRMVWVLQGDDRAQQESRKQSPHFRSSYEIALSKKERDPEVNNAGYRSASARASVLRRQLGEVRYNQLVRQLSQELGVR